MYNRTGIMLQTVLSLMANNIRLPPQSEDTYQFNSTTRCFPEFGCFSIEPPWTSAARPISLLPESPSKISPKFCLFTRRNPRTCQRLIVGDDNSVYRSNIAPHSRLVFVSHGYLENGNKPWMKTMMSELLKSSDVNVVLVDWGGGSAPPYSQAVANTRIVGTVAAHLIGQLNKLGVRTQDTHIIGHSLGSHIAAYIGQVLSDKFHIKLARISALDPAEPHFTKTHHSMRLDPSDARFVDVTHTDTAPFISGGLGLLEPVGHVDFYPNGGAHQPGCSETMARYIGMERGSFVGGLQKFLSCNHIRSYKYYSESINSVCPYTAIACESWEAFRNGSCFRCATELSEGSVRRGERLCATYGYHSLPNLLSQWRDKPIKLYRQQMFLMTGSSTPYCQEHYRITLHISGLLQSVKHGEEIGMFWVTVLGDRGTSHRTALSTSEQLYEPGSIHRVVVASRGVGKIRSAYIEWEYRMSFLNPLSWRVLGQPKIYLSWLTIDNLESGETIQMCLPDGHALLTADPLLLHHSSACNVTLPAPAPTAAVVAAAAA